jgi:LPXTG-motif cell wall-anchored protein
MDVGPTTQPGGGGVPPQAITALPSPEVETRPRYAGCIARFNKTRKVYRIYCPIGVSPAGFGAGEYFRCLRGDCGNLGADAVTPPIPTGFNPTPAVETTALPGEGETPAGEEKDKFFRANNPAMWTLFAGTAVAIGGGGYWYVRRRKRSA